MDPKFNPLYQPETKFTGEVQKFSGPGLSPDDPSVKSRCRNRWLHKTLAIHIPAWLLWALFLFTFAIGVGLIIWNKPPPDPLLEKFRMLEIGMAANEVAEILGGPGQRGMGDAGNEKLLGWLGKGIEVWVVFDSDNRVIRKGYNRY